MTYLIENAETGVIYYPSSENGRSVIGEHRGGFLNSRAIVFTRRGAEKRLESYRQAMPNIAADLIIVEV